MDWMALGVVTTVGRPVRTWTTPYWSSQGEHAMRGADGNRVVTR